MGNHFGVHTIANKIFSFPLFFCFHSQAKLHTTPPLDVPETAVEKKVEVRMEDYHEGNLRYIDEEYALALEVGYLSSKYTLFLRL
jgi:hypothetical protein